VPAPAASTRRTRGIPRLPGTPRPPRPRRPSGLPLVSRRMRGPRRRARGRRAAADLRTTPGEGRHAEAPTRSGERAARAYLVKARASRAAHRRGSARADPAAGRPEKAHGKTGRQPGVREKLREGTGRQPGVLCPTERVRRAGTQGAQGAQRPLQYRKARDRGAVRVRHHPLTERAGPPRRHHRAGRAGQRPPVVVKGQAGPVLRPKGRSGGFPAAAPGPHRGMGGAVAVRVRPRAVPVPVVGHGRRIAGSEEATPAQPAGPRPGFRRAPPVPGVVTGLRTGSGPGLPGPPGPGRIRFRRALPGIPRPGVRLRRISAGRADCAFLTRSPHSSLTPRRGSS
jgi:hypothetical protein